MHSISHKIELLKMDLQTVRGSIQFRNSKSLEKTLMCWIYVTAFLYEGLEEAGFEVALRPTMKAATFRNANRRFLHSNRGNMTEAVPSFLGLTAFV